jgi:hypothetical protein
MADVKTNLRELSVVLGLFSYSIDEVRNKTPSEFYNLVKNRVDNDISKAENIESLDSFTIELKDIIKNGMKLGKAIIDLKIINCIDNAVITWLGYDSQKNDPIDLKIGNVGFSLKEESYILENMGLYKYVNLMTKSNFKRGLHIFETYASEEYKDWFLYTWGKLIESCRNSNWRLSDNDKTVEITLENEEINLIMNGSIICRIPISIKSPAEFIELTSVQVREKVFSKWINKKLRRNTDYKNLKRICAEKAGENITNFINTNLDLSGISRFLQIYDEQYFYAKTTSAGVEIYRVPSQKEFNNVYSLNKVTYSVPKSQLNILTTIENTGTKKKLTIRNECRFSHGQFNGTPEAKMYYENGSDLSVIYIKL